ncbi:MAG: hypothetical protein H6638_01610 [Ardenticatenales bacterium]|nr:hypothetical protein [Ardenticatenales bacterium]
MSTMSYLGKAAGWRGGGVEGVGNYFDKGTGQTAKDENDCRQDGAPLKFFAGGRTAWICHFMDIPVKDP